MEGLAAEQGLPEMREDFRPQRADTVKRLGRRRHGEPVRDLFLAKKSRGKHSLLSWDDYERSAVEERHKNVVYAEIERKLKEVRGTIPRPDAEVFSRHIKVCH